MHFKMLSASCFNLDQSKILPSGNGLTHSTLNFNDRMNNAGWLVVFGFNATLTAKFISWQSVMHVFPGFLTPVLTQLFFPKPPTTFLTCFCRGERRKYARKKPGHESDTLTTEPPRQGK